MSPVLFILYYTFGKGPLGYTGMRARIQVGLVWFQTSALNCHPQLLPALTMDLKSTGKLTSRVHLGDTAAGQHHNVLVKSTFLRLYPRVLLFSCPTVFDSLWPHGLQHARPPCPSPSPKVCPSSCPLHWWCRPATSSSDALFFFCPQSFPASGTFLMSWLFTSWQELALLLGLQLLNSFFSPLYIL